MGLSLIIYHHPKYYRYAQLLWMPNYVMGNLRGEISLQTHKYLNIP
jgi:hypothetical protein